MAFAHHSDVVENATDVVTRLRYNEDVNWEMDGLGRHFKHPEDAIVMGRSLKWKVVVLMMSEEIGD